MPRLSFSLLFLSCGLFLIGCEPVATEDQINRMCDRLLVVRNKPGDVEMKKQCVAEAIREGVSQRQALCRISAVNKLEYWNRCRTGEAR